MLRKGSRLENYLGPQRIKFLAHALDSFERLLPHLEVKNFSQIDWAERYVSWQDDHKKVAICIPIGNRKDSESASLTFTIVRRVVISSLPLKKRTIHQREYRLCGLIVDRIIEVLAIQTLKEDELTFPTLMASFDEHIVVNDIASHNNLKIDVVEIISAIHELSEATYENKAMTFGCIITQDIDKKNESVFPKSC